MKVESQAGKFILDFQQMEPGDGEIIISGKMGVWDAKTHMSLPEFVRLLGMTMRPRMLVFLIKSLFGGGFRSRPDSAS
jgi:hypothetical protein